MLPGTDLTTEMKMKQLGILPLQHKLKFNKGVLTYKIIKHESADDISNIFSEKYIVAI